MTPFRGLKSSLIFLSNLTRVLGNVSKRCFWDVVGVKIIAVRHLCEICISFSPGLFSLKKKIEDAVQRTEMMAPTALQIEEARWIKQDGLIRDYDLWDDPAKSNDALVKLADIARAVDSLRDLTYKVMWNAISIL